MPLGIRLKSKDPEERKTEEFIKTTIKDNDVVIFSKTSCIFCDLAKSLFQKLDQPFKVIELDKRDDWDLFQTVLGMMTGAKTVPRVFVKGKSLGGSFEVKDLYETGKLKKMLTNE